MSRTGLGKIETALSDHIFTLYSTNNPPKCGGSSKNPDDYRGISIQSIALKTFCSILENRLADFVETPPSCEQNGFRKDRNCLDYIFSTTQARLSENRDTFVCYVDLKKAFEMLTELTCGTS